MMRFILYTYNMLYDLFTHWLCNYIHVLLVRIWALLHKQITLLKGIKQVEKNNNKKKKQKKKNSYTYYICPILVWLAGLEFKGQVDTINVMSRRSVYLTTLFLSRLSPLGGKPVKKTNEKKKKKKKKLNK